MIAGVIAVGMGDKGKLAHVARVEPELGRREPNPTLVIDNHHGRILALPSANWKFRSEPGRNEKP